MDSITFQKLRDIEARFQSIETQMSDPNIMQDPSAYQKLAKESKDMAPVVDRFRTYRATPAELARVQERAKAESDPERRERAQKEARALESRRDGLDAEIPPLLIPK